MPHARCMVCALMKKTPTKTVIQEIIIKITIIKCELAVWLSDYHYPIYLNRFTRHIRKTSLFSRLTLLHKLRFPLIALVNLLVKMKLKKLPLPPTPQTIPLTIIIA